MSDQFTIERVFFAGIEQSNAINAAGDPDCTQKRLAGFYADCIIADRLAKCRNEPGVNWQLVNEAVLARWPGALAAVCIMMKSGKFIRNDAPSRVIFRR